MCAVTAISVRLLGNSDAETFGMFGCGVQGREHIKFLSKVMPNLKKIYVFDSIEQHLHFKDSGYYPNSLSKKIYAELGEVVAGLKPGCESKYELIIANNIEMAIEDMIIAKAVFDIALKKDMGKKLLL